jgi:hypothetical protein
MRLSPLFLMTACVPGSQRRIASSRYLPTVQRAGLETQHRPRDTVRSALAAGTPGGVYGGAVATPVFGVLRPPKTSCTPIVASGVATAGHFVKIHQARPWPPHSGEEI